MSHYSSIAIMQPTYLSWIGYFDMMDQVDCFVLLDHVQFSERSWQQRNRIKTPNGASWLSVPVLKKGRRDQRIQNVEIDPTQDFPSKHLKAIAHSYARSPHFAHYFSALETLMTQHGRNLCDLNIAQIEWFRDQLGIRTPILRSSSMDVSGSKTELLVSICRHLNAGHYLSAEGSRTYIEENNLFPENHIALRYHTYQHPAYRQLHGPFVSHLSTLDLLLNEGEASLDIIRSGRTLAAAVPVKQ